MKLILASKSEGRKKLLEEAGYTFKAVESGFDESEVETEDFEKHEDYAKHLALSKAMLVAFEKDEGIIIGADTMVVFDGALFGKPKTPEEAIKVLTLLSGKWHEIITGIAVINTETQEKAVDVVKSRVKFKKLSKKQIEDYVATGEPLKKAGGYDISNGAKNFVEKIEGSETNICGLPMERLSEILKRMASS